MEMTIVMVPDVFIVGTKPDNQYNVHKVVISILTSTQNANC